MAGICINGIIRVGRCSCLALAFFLCSCSSEVKIEERLVGAFVELRLADIAYGADSPMARLTRQKVLKDFGYTRKEYLDEIQVILDDENRWIPFQKAVNERLDSLLVVRKMPEEPAPKGPPRTMKGVKDD